MSQFPNKNISPYKLNLQNIEYYGRLPYNKYQDKIYDVYLAKSYICSDEQDCDFYYFPLLKEINMIPLADWSKPTGAKWQFNYSVSGNYAKFTECNNSNFAIVPINNYNGLKYINSSPQKYGLTLLADTNCRYLFYINNLLKLEGFLKPNRASIIFRYDFSNGITISLNVVPSDTSIKKFDGVILLAI